jgi:hypothetical protein
MGAYCSTLRLLIGLLGLPVSLDDRKRLAQLLDEMRPIGDLEAAA